MNKGWKLSGAKVWALPLPRSLGIIKNPVPYTQQRTINKYPSCSYAVAPSTLSPPLAPRVPIHANHPPPSPTSGDVIPPLPFCLSFSISIEPSSGLVSCGWEGGISTSSTTRETLRDTTANQKSS